MANEELLAKIADLSTSTPNHFGQQQQQHFTEAKPFSEQPSEAQLKSATAEYYNDLDSLCGGQQSGTRIQSPPGSESALNPSVHHCRYPSSDDSHSLNCFAKPFTNTDTTMVAIDFPVLSARNSPATGAAAYKFTNTFATLPSSYGHSATAANHHHHNNTSRRSHEEDIYEDLCYVTLRSSREREKALGTLLLEPIEKRDYCIKELVETERNYCEALRMIINHFYQPLSKVLHLEDRRLIFNNLRSLTDVHGKFYNELYCACSGATATVVVSNQLVNTSTYQQPVTSNLMAAASMPSLPIINTNTVISSPATTTTTLMMPSSPTSGSVCNLPANHEMPKTNAASRLSSCFLNFKDRFLIYGEYCANLPKAQALLDELCARDELVGQCVARCQNKANEGKFKLRDLLSLPMQRILKYHLLLAELIKTTAETHEDFAGLKQAHDVMLDIGGYINEVKRDTETLDIIRSVQRSIIDLSMPENYELTDYGRLIKDGELRIRSNEDPRMRLKNRYVFIFDKVVLMCKTLRGVQYSYKEAIVLEEYRVEDLCNTSPISKLTKNWSNGWSLVNVRTKHTYTFYAKSEDLKRKWLDAIERAQDNVRPKDLQRSDHRFSMSTVPVATYCAVCLKLLRGTWYQGYQCAVCNVAVHKCCLPSVRPCGSGADSAQMFMFKKDSNDCGGSYTVRKNGRFNSNSTVRPPGTQSICAPLTPSRSKRIIAKAITAHYSGNGHLGFDVDDTLIVFAKHSHTSWYGRNVRTGEEGCFSPSSVTELAADSPASSSLDSPTVNSSASQRFSYDDPFGPVNETCSNLSFATLPRKFPFGSASSTPSPQSALIPSSPLAASTPAVNMATNSGNYFFSSSSLIPLQPNSPPEDEASMRLMYGNGYNLEEYAWFAGSMDRDTAQTTLSPLPNGSFLVRISPKQKNSYAISINYKGHVKHMRVCVTDVAGIVATTVQPEMSAWPYKSHYYLSETRYFRTIVDLVRWYEQNSLNESFHMVNTRLVLPYKKAYSSEILGHAVALYAFTGTSSAASSFLSLRKGDRVTVLSRAAEEKGWWKGEISDRIGYFPFKYVSPTTPSLTVFNSVATSTCAASSAIYSDSISLVSSALTDTSNLSPTSPLCAPQPLGTTTTDISQDQPKVLSPSISPSSFSSTSSTSSSSSPTTLSSPVNSDTLSMHSRQASSDAGIEVSSAFSNNQLNGSIPMHFQW